MEASFIMTVNAAIYPINIIITSASILSHKVYGESKSAIGLQASYGFTSVMHSSWSPSYSLRKYAWNAYLKIAMCWNGIKNHGILS